MPADALARRLETLQALATRIAQESAGGILGEGLEAVLGATSARACIAFGVDGTGEPLAERGPLARAAIELPPVKQELQRCASRAATSRRALAIADTTERDDIDGTLLANAGIHAVLAEPIKFRRTVLGVLVVLFEDKSALDSGVGQHVSAVASLVALALDAERRAEQQRTEREQISAGAGVGLLSATLSSELRAPTGALALQHEELRQISDQIGLLAGTGDATLASAGTELSELVQDMGVAIARLGGVAERLCSAGRRESSLEQVDLATVAKQSLAMARAVLKQRGVPLEEEYEEGSVTLGRRDDLEQLVLNLVLNAADAAQSSRRPHVWLKVVKGPTHVALVVEDSGPGVPPDRVENIFDGVYSGKEVTRGAGLGLKIVSEVVAAHGGHIEVQEREGGGASFRVVLPRAPESGARALAGKARPSERPDGIRHIFLVDDDPMFARAVRRGLKPHEVRTAAAASEAEMALLDPGYEPDLVVCDIVLPGAHGDALHERIKAKRPEVAARFVFVTGIALATETADYLKTSGCSTLRKPIDVHGLRTLLSPRAEPESSPPVSVTTLAENIDSEAPTAAPPRRG